MSEENRFRVGDRIVDLERLEGNDFDGEDWGIGTITYVEGIKLGVKFDNRRNIAARDSNDDTLVFAHIYNSPLMLALREEVSDD